MNIKLFHKPFSMRRCRFGANPQDGSHLFCSFSFRYQLQDLALPGAEVSDPVILEAGAVSSYNRVRCFWTLI